MKKNIIFILITISFFLFACSSDKEEKNVSNEKSTESSVDNSNKEDTDDELSDLLGLEKLGSMTEEDYEETYDSEEDDDEFLDKLLEEDDFDLSQLKGQLQTNNPLMKNIEMSDELPSWVAVEYNGKRYSISEYNQAFREFNQASPRKLSKLEFLPEFIGRKEIKAKALNHPFFRSSKGQKMLSTVAKQGMVEMYIMDKTAKSSQAFSKKKLKEFRDFCKANVDSMRHLGIDDAVINSDRKLKRFYSNYKMLEKKNELFESLKNNVIIKYNDDEVIDNYVTGNINLKDATSENYKNYWLLAIKEVPENNTPDNLPSEEAPPEDFPADGYSEDLDNDFITAEKIDEYIPQTEKQPDKVVEENEKLVSEDELARGINPEDTEIDIDIMRLAKRENVFLNNGAKNNNKPVITLKPKSEKKKKSMTEYKGSIVEPNSDADPDDSVLEETEEVIPPDKVVPKVPIDIDSATKIDEDTLPTSKKVVPEIKLDVDDKDNSILQSDDMLLPYDDTDDIITNDKSERDPLVDELDFNLLPKEKDESIDLIPNVEQPTKKIQTKVRKKKKLSKRKKLTIKKSKLPYKSSKHTDYIYVKDIEERIDLLKKNNPRLKKVLKQSPEAKRQLLQEFLMAELISQSIEQKEVKNWNKYVNMKQKIKNNYMMNYYMKHFFSKSRMRDLIMNILKNNKIKINRRYFE